MTGTEPREPGKDKFSFRKLTVAAIMAATIVLGVYYIAAHMDEFRGLSFTDAWLLVPLILMSLAVSWALGLLIKFLLKPFGINLKFREWFGLSVITTLYNTITPFRGGMIARAVYLKQKHGFSYANFLAIMSGIYVINFFIQGAAGLASAWAISAQSKVFSPVIFAVFGLFFVSTLVMIVFSPKLPQSKNALINKLVDIVNGWHLIRNNKKVVSMACFTALLQLLFTAAATSITYRMFGADVGIVKSLFLSSVSLLGIVVSVTPGSLGIAEAISVFSALAIGITVAHSLPVVILTRLVSMSVIFTLGPVYTYILLKHSPAKTVADISKMAKES